MQLTIPDNFLKRAMGWLGAAIAGALMTGTTGYFKVAVPGREARNAQGICCQLARETSDKLIACAEELGR